MPVKLPTTEYLHECFHYNPETGVLRWKERPQEHFASARDRDAWNTRFAQKDVGTTKADRRLQVSLDRHKYKAHRIIWKLVTGDEPPSRPDHKDGNPLNNKWDNLRPATQSQQNYNKGLQRNNTSGYRGVYRMRTQWLMGIRIDGIQYYRCFNTPEEASAAYEALARKHHGEFYRTPRPKPI